MTKKKTESGLHDGDTPNAAGAETDTKKGLKRKVEKALEPGHQPINPVSFSKPKPAVLSISHIVFHASIDGFHKRELHIDEIKDLIMFKLDDEFHILFKDKELIFPPTSILYYELKK